MAKKPQSALKISAAMFDEDYDDPVGASDFVMAHSTPKSKEEAEALDKTGYKRIYDGGREQLIPMDKLVEAPEEWNFFPAPPEGIYFEIKDSIQNNGLWSAIVVWAQPDGTYMILGGHTRYHIYQELYNETGDEKYTTIKANVYENNELSSTDARRLCILTNTGSRARESARVMFRVVLELTKLEKEHSYYGSGDMAKRISNLLNTGRSTIMNVRRLGNLIPEVFALLDTTKITFKQAYAAAGANPEIQKFLLSKGFSNFDFKEVASIASCETISEAQQVTDVIEKAHRERKSNAIYPVKVYIPMKMPKTCQAIPLIADSEDVAIIQECLKSLGRNKDIKLSDTTRQILNDLYK